MSHFGALAAASSRYAALCGNPADPRTLPWYWGRLPSQMQEKCSSNGKINKKNLDYSKSVESLEFSLLTEL